MKIYTVLTRNESKNVVGAPYCAYTNLEEAEAHANKLTSIYSDSNLSKKWTVEIIELVVIW